MASTSYSVALMASILLHAILIVLMLSSWQTVEERPLRAQTKVVKATLVELNAKAVQKTQIIDLRANRAAEQRAEEARKLAQKQRDQEAQRKLEQQKRKDEIERKKLAELAEQQRQDELQQQRLEAETRAQAERQRRASEFQQALAEEADYQASLQDQQLVDSVGYQIERAVETNWSRPPSARRGMEVVLRVSLVPTGGLSSVEVLTSSGDSVFDRSAMQAVQKAAPFDAVKSLTPVIFETNFRRFQFRFSPQDLRL